MVFILLAILIPVIYRCIVPRSKILDFDTQLMLPLKGILALLIVLHHLSQQYDFNISFSFLEHNITILNPLQQMGGVVVGVFFFISGYGLAKSISRKGAKYLDNFLKKRFKAILPVFLFLTVIMVLYYAIFQSISFSEQLRLLAQGTPPLPNSWFIYAILYVYLAFYFSAKSCGCNINRTGLFLLFYIVAYMLITWQILHWGGWWYQSIPCVISGYFIAAYEKYITGLLKNKKLIYTTILFIALLIALNIVSHKAFMLAMMYMIVLFTYIAVRVCGISRNKLMLLLGNISLNIYLVQGIVLLALKSIDINKYLAVFAAIILSCSIAYLLRTVLQFANLRIAAR